MVNLGLSDAYCAREKGDGYLTGSLTSGIKVKNEQSDVVKRGKGYISFNSDSACLALHHP